MTRELPFFADDTENSLSMMVTVIQQNNNRCFFKNRLLFNNMSIMCFACKDSFSLLSTWRSGVKDDMMAWGRTRIAQSYHKVSCTFLSKGPTKRLASRNGSGTLWRHWRKRSVILVGLCASNKFALMHGIKHVNFVVIYARGFSSTTTPNRQHLSHLFILNVFIST
jgi:hypothetical protein